MDPDTIRSSLDSDPADLYWRRRAFALAAVLLAAALVAWACSSVAGTSKRKTAAAPRAAAASPGLAAAGSTPQPNSSGLPAPLPTVTVTVTATVTPPGTQRGAGDACNPADIVIYMTGAKSTYRRGDEPQFMITVVNTGKRVCTFDVGPEALQLRITSGSDRVWTSAACVGSEGSDIRRFSRGIPYVKTVEWDRTRTPSDCDEKGKKARDGTYVAVVKSGSLKSPRVVFRLR